MESNPFLQKDRARRQSLPAESVKANFKVSRKQKQPPDDDKDLPELEAIEVQPGLATNKAWEDPREKRLREIREQESAKLVEQESAAVTSSSWEDPREKRLREMLEVLEQENEAQAEAQPEPVAEQSWEDPREKRLREMRERGIDPLAGLVGKTVDVSKKGGTPFKLKTIPKRGGGKKDIEDVVRKGSASPAEAVPPDGGKPFKLKMIGKRRKKEKDTAVVGEEGRVNDPKAVRGETAKMEKGEEASTIETKRGNQDVEQEGEAEEGEQEEKLKDQEEAQKAQEAHEAHEAQEVGGKQQQRDEEEEDEEEEGAHYELIRLPPGGGLIKLQPTLRAFAEDGEAEGDQEEEEEEKEEEEKEEEEKKGGTDAKKNAEVKIADTHSRKGSAESDAETVEYNLKDEESRPEEPVATDGIVTRAAEVLARKTSGRFEVGGDLEVIANASPTASSDDEMVELERQFAEQSAKLESVGAGGGADRGADGTEAAQSQEEEHPQATSAEGTTDDANPASEASPIRKHMRFRSVDDVVKALSTAGYDADCRDAIRALVKKYPVGKEKFPLAGKRRQRKEKEELKKRNAAASNGLVQVTVGTRPKTASKSKAKLVLDDSDSEDDEAQVPVAPVPRLLLEDSDTDSDEEDFTPAQRAHKRTNSQVLRAAAAWLQQAKPRPRPVPE
jgi:hypothetical protein